MIRPFNGTEVEYLRDGETLALISSVGRPYRSKLHIAVPIPGEAKQVHTLCRADRASRHGARAVTEEDLRPGFSSVECSRCISMRRKDS